MNRILTPLTEIVNRYLSTKVVYLLDMIMSLIASIVTLVLVNIIAVRNLFEIRTQLTDKDCRNLDGDFFRIFCIIPADFP